LVIQFMDGFLARLWLTWAVFYGLLGAEPRAS
jgi:hypothetical protein